MNKPTEQETKWALAIKQAAQQDPDIHTDLICDLEYIQHAIVAKDKVQDALDRIRRMQHFKTQHSIKMDGSAEEGMRDLATFQRAHPGFFLSLGSLPDGSPIIAVDSSRTVLRDIKSEESIAVFLRGMFYSMQACHSSICAMRTGSVTLSDMGGCDWRHRNRQVTGRNAELYSRAYPKRHTLIVLLNVSFLWRLTFAWFKLLIPKKMWERYILLGDPKGFLQGACYPPTVLPAAWNDKYCDGTMEQQGLQQAFRERLKARYDLAAKFKLE